MKKFISVIALLLIAGAVSAADYLDSFAAYRTRMRAKLGMTSTATSYLSDSTLNECVREALVLISPAIKGAQTTVSFTTTFQQDTYNMDSLVSISGVVWSYNDSVKSLLYVPREKFYQQEHRFTSSKGFTRVPSYYDYTPSTITLYPVPSTAGDTIKVTGERRIPNLATTATLTSVPQQYRAAILLYATYAAAHSITHPLTETYWRDLEMSLILLGINVPKAAASR